MFPNLKIVGQISKILSDELALFWIKHCAHGNSNVVLTEFEHLWYSVDSTGKSMEQNDEQGQSANMIKSNFFVVHGVSSCQFFMRGFQSWLLPLENEVWGKVMFSEASVILSRGGV